LLLTACLAFAPAAARAEWQAVEKVQTYAISGQSGIELYRSIGERGPQAGIGRTIAYTDFKLTWQRDYQPRDGACTLVSARPKLVITYRLPEPSEKLPASTQKLWETFSAGVAAHEKVHGEFIVEMVKAIEAATIGLSVPGDPECRKIRAEMTKRLSALSLAQRRKSRDFDRVELSDGGAVHQLILNLVNGR
jgi:predicted secreted Zn-dependent protease